MHKTVALDSYLQYLGFPTGNNPFASVNARDERAVLEGYFVAPPYFETLWGDPADPKSAIVMAPIGGGKTALAVMIDERARALQKLPDGRLPLLIIVYDDFTKLGLSETRQGLKSHLAAINYLLTINIIITVASTSVPHMRISSDERLLLRHCYATYVGGRAQSEVFHDLEKLQTPFEYLQSVGKRATSALPVVSIIANALELAADKLQAAADVAKAITKLDTQTRSMKASPEIDFHRLIDFAGKYFQSVYILVDRADETPWTQRNAEATYKLMHPLVANLNLLDRADRKYAFKFFLWDGIKKHYANRARGDRIFVRDLDWKADQLMQMLDNRVRAFSKGNLRSLDQVFAESLELPKGRSIKDLIAIFAGTSPRAMVTLCKYMLEEQLNLINQERLEMGKIGNHAITSGIQRFANETAHRLIPDEKALREITSIKRTVFTSKALHSDVFRGHSPESVRSKVGKWKRFNISQQVGNETTGKRGFPVEVHAFTDPSVAYLSSGLTLVDFVDQKVKRCSKCGTILLRDFERGGQFQCHMCLTGFDLPKFTTEAQERQQGAVRKFAKELSKVFAEPADIRSVCRASNVPLEDSAFTGQPFLIWLRVLQFMIEKRLEDLPILIDVIDDALPSDSKAKQEALPEFILAFSLDA